MIYAFLFISCFRVYQAWGSRTPSWNGRTSMMTLHRCVWCVLTWALRPEAPPTSCTGNLHFHGPTASPLFTLSADPLLLKRVLLKPYCDFKCVWMLIKERTESKQQTSVWRNNWYLVTHPRPIESHQKFSGTAWHVLRERWGMGFLILLI